MQTKKTTYAAALYEGTFSVGLDKKFIRIGRDDNPAKGALKISLNPFLIKGEQRTFLFDTGIGEFAEGSSTETILENLENHELTEYDISDIFISHLHYDHIGGLAGRPSSYWELTFPDAKLWISEKEWDKFTSRDTYYDEEKTEFLQFVQATADIHLLDEQDQPYPEIRVEKIGGHTEFSQMILFDDSTQKYLMAGDVLATRGEVNRKFAAKYDYDPKTSLKKRQKITKKAWKEHYTVMAYHDSHHPLFRLSGYNERKGYTIENLEADETA